ncbi:hypothetical protein [Deinococcus sp.]|uniref:hypothetical protein n=1 Tax=Deinococcus sp. TaxID=47478 RepID=UPI0025CBA379|nr:hypothetical protein [Deinococcus sp.]
MKTTLRMLLTLGLLSQASATDLRLYQNFAEVRMPVTAPNETFTIDLAAPMFGGLYPGTLDLEQYSELRHGENSLPAPPFCVLLS